METISQEVWADVLAGRLPANTIFTCMVFIVINGRWRRILKIERMGKRWKGKKAEICDNHCKIAKNVGKEEKKKQMLMPEAEAREKFGKNKIFFY